jgi:hypothetical protein
MRGSTWRGAPVYPTETTFDSERASALQEALRSAVDVVLSDERVQGRVGRAEALRYVTRLFDFARNAEVENHNPAYPSLTKAESPWVQWGWPNPDYVYWQAPVHGDYTYRLYGKRGTARLFTVETWDGDWSRISRQRILDTATQCADGTGELQLGPDGEFQITVGRENRGGNHLRIGEGPGLVFIRDCYYDWEHERPSWFYIERDGATYPAPAPTAEELESNLDKLSEFLREAPGLLLRAVGQHYAADHDSMAFPSLAEALGTDTGFPSQYYGRGSFRCETGEAVIIEVAPTECAYWGVQIGSQFWEAFDWHLRPNSINGHQAVIDSDGVFRAVIAHHDPGVPNWLDPGGHLEGLVGCRWNRPKNPQDCPVPSMRTVKLADLDAELPADTPRISAQQRSEILRRRMLSVRRRTAD